MKTDMELLSNSMAAYAHVKANPESLALYFVMGVCVGLLMALGLMVTALTCRTGRRPRPALGRSQPEARQSAADEEDVGVAPSPGGGDVFASAEELEKARRLEERERILREIWRNGQPDILLTGTATIGRPHYR